MKAMSAAERLSELSKVFLPIFAALAIVLPIMGTAAWFVFGDFIKSKAAGLVDLPVSAGACVVIPATGHYIEDTPIDHYGRITWRDVNRIRTDCGKPLLFGIISNGGGLLHDSKLSISGVPLTLGKHEVSYRFHVPDGVDVGPARFRVMISFPDAVGGAPVATTPWVTFKILDKDSPEGSL